MLSSFDNTNAYPSYRQVQDNSTVHLTLVFLKLEKFFLPLKNFKKEKRKKQFHCSQMWETGYSRWCSVKWDLCKPCTWSTPIVDQAV